MPWRDEVVTPPIRVRDGRVSLPEGPGLGIAVAHVGTRFFSSPAGGHRAGVLYRHARASQYAYAIARSIIPPNIA